MSKNRPGKGSKARKNRVDQPFGTDPSDTRGNRPSGSRDHQVSLIPPTEIPAVYLSSPVRQPLVYRKRIRHVDPWAKNGDLVAVYADFPGETAEVDTRLLGYGLLNRKAEISLRMIRFGEELPDEKFWDALLLQAVELRRDVLKLDEIASAYRLIHAESDGFPGLVVDRYGDVLSAEVFSLGMSLRAEQLLQRLLRMTETKHFLIRGAPHTLAQEGFQQSSRRSADLPDSTIIEEFGTRFLVSHDDEAHKTGFFCDQRENRRRLAAYCEGKTLLDLCCYTGGFAIQGMRLGKAKEAIGVDLDDSPLQIARQNARLNQVSARFVAADIFPYMRDMLRQGRQFDVVVLDPPKLIRSRSEYEEGKKTHFDMNRLAMRLVRPGGIFLTCTCAGLLDSQEFLSLVVAGARGASRPSCEAGDPLTAALAAEVPLRILEKTGAGGDHPVAVNALETEYLRGIWCQRAAIY